MKQRMVACFGISVMRTTLREKISMKEKRTGGPVHSQHGIILQGEFERVAGVGIDMARKDISHRMCFNEPDWTQGIGTHT
jgi:hypothetical protein